MAAVSAHIYDFTKISLDVFSDFDFDAFKPTTEEKAKDLYTEREHKNISGRFSVCLFPRCIAIVFRLHAVADCAQLFLVSARLVSHLAAVQHHRLRKLGQAEDLSSCFVNSGRERSGMLIVHL